MPNGTTERPRGAAYVQTNEPINRVVAYGRADDGTLARLDDFETGGAGDGNPHLTSQGSVMLCGDDMYLLVTNAASHDIGVFTVMERGLERIATTPAGAAPKCIAEHDGLVYALCTGEPSVVGFRLTEDGLNPLENSERMLSAPNADPAQVGFSADGSTLIVTERGTNAIVAFDVGGDGRLGEMRVTLSAGPTPYGFTFARSGVLVVTEAFGGEKGEAAASSYRLDDGVVEPVTPSVHNGRSEICWAVATPGGRYVFATNFADGAVSRYAVAADGTLSLDDAIAGMSEEGRPGLRDLDLTADGRFLYAIDSDIGRVYGWAVGENGALTRVATWDDLPNTIAGLAVR